MNQAVFTNIRQIVYEHSGISLGPGKEALVSARLSKRLRALNLETYEEYLHLLAQKDSGELVHFLDSISTNVTSFFREPEHFDALAGWLGEWRAAGQTRFRIWSAACSSGEEPYSIAMVAADVLGLDADFKILATDISSRVLETAMAGTYAEERVASIPKVYQERYLDRGGKRTGQPIQVNARLREKVTFRRFNLSLPKYPMRGPLDLIFCRNVMIYFDNALRKQLLGECFRLLRPGGYLLVGHTESLTGVCSDFGVVRPSIYTKR